MSTSLHLRVRFTYGRIVVDLQDGLRIGEVADLAGCATSAVRYYERVGLIDPPQRVGGQRRYPARAVQRLQLILLLRRVGLGIRDVALALDHSPDGAAARRAAARQRAQAVRAQLEDSARALAIFEHGADCTSSAPDDAACAADIERRFIAAGLDPRITTLAVSADALVR